MLTPSATSAATGPSRRSGRSSRTPPTPDGWSGTGSTSPPSAKPAARPASAPKRNGSSPRSNTRLWSRTSCSRRGPGALPRPPPRSNVRAGVEDTYLFTGTVRCRSGHQPLAMYGAQPQAPHLHDLRLRAHLRLRVAADQIEGHGQWLSVREDALSTPRRAFFAERVFGPMRLEKLARQLRTHKKATAKAENVTEAPTRVRSPTSTDRIGKQIEGSRQGVEPQLVSQRIEKLRGAKEAAEIELRDLAPAAADSEPSEDLRRAPRAHPRPSQRPAPGPDRAQAPGVRRLLPADHLRQTRAGGSRSGPRSPRSIANALHNA